MKKIRLAIFLVLFIILNYGYSVIAYSTSEYSIDIPANYNKVSENSFTDEIGHNISIQIVPYDYATTEYPYTEENLNKLVENIYSEMDTYRDELKQVLREKNEKYGANLTEEQINEYANSFKCNSIEKEITTFTKNNYNGFHIISNYSMGDISTYANQYMVISGKKVYTLTISWSSMEEVNSFKNKDIVNSFTINNFQPINNNKESFAKKMGDATINAVIKTVIWAIIIAICGGIGALIRKADRNKICKNETNDLQEENDNLKDENLNDIIEKKTDNMEKIVTNIIDERKICTNCGKEIESTWDFCKYCGNKLE